MRGWEAFMLRQHRAELRARGAEPTTRQASFARGEEPLAGLTIRTDYPRVRARLPVRRSRPRT